MASTKGILYVTMHPRSPESSLTEFHDWYQNEHGPARLRLKPFLNGFRYKAADGKAPGFMAIYDLDDMDSLVGPDYSRLRVSPAQTQRERDVMAKLFVDRRFYDFGAEHTSPEFTKLENIENAPGATNVLVAASVTLKDEQLKAKYEEWFDQEHVSLLSKVLGWKRSRRYVTSTLDKDHGFEILGLHEYSVENGLGGEQYEAALNTQWRTNIFAAVVKEKKRRVWDLFYVFGPAPRDLENPSYSMKYPDGRTNVLYEKEKTALISYVTTPDGAVIPYRLDGSSKPNAPTIVLINSVLVTWEIWDSFASIFATTAGNAKYRLLRFNSRGRDDNVGTEPVTIDLLARDVITLMDALQLHKADLVIGVSLGGVTALNLALSYPKRIGAFVSCDTNSLAPPNNPELWDARIAVSEKENAAEAGVGIIGNDLAEQTVNRWFPKTSYSDQQKAEIAKVKKMVAANTIRGFSTGVKALYKYDLTSKMKLGTVKGLFVVGSEDGVLPKTMKEMASQYGDGSSALAVIHGAGHLPSVDEPDQFSASIQDFVRSI